MPELPMVTSPGFCLANAITSVKFLGAKPLDETTTSGMAVV